MITSFNKYKLNEIYSLIQKNDLSGIKEWVKQGNDINQKLQGLTPLLFAFRKMNHYYDKNTYDRGRLFNVTKYMIENCDLTKDIKEKRNGNNLTPLMYALYYFNIDGLDQLIIDNGSDFYFNDELYEDLLWKKNNPNRIYKYGPIKRRTLNPGLLDNLIDAYPERYDEYKTHKNTKKYKI